MCNCVYVDSRICNLTQAFGSRIVMVLQALALQFFVHVKDMSFCEWYDVLFLHLSHAGSYIEYDEANNGPPTLESETAVEQVKTETRAPKRLRPT